MSDAPPASAGDDDLSSEVRQRLGLKSGQAAMFEACGDAIRAIIGSADERASSEWHEAKLRALGGDDRDKKLLALRHLDSGDFDDDSMFAAVIESLERDDDTLALTFAVTAGSLIDPAGREDILRLLLDELHRYERRGQSRGAFFGVLLFHIYENHAGAVPPDWLIAEWTSSVATSEDPASFAALVDLCVSRCESLRRRGDH